MISDMISVYRSSDIRLPFSLGEKRKLRAARGSGITASPNQVLTHAARAASPNQMLTHAARAAASQLNKPLRGRARRARRALVRATRGCKAAKNFQPPLVAARGAREGLWLEQYHRDKGAHYHGPSRAASSMLCERSERRTSGQQVG